MKSPSWIIQKKRDGKELTTAELKFFIEGMMTGEVADYQASAFLMAIYFRGLSLDETIALTQAMIESGERYDLSEVRGFKVDKHSTGGVGDKVSLILAPLAAACGLKVPMMSGRGLGHSGGTLDKLESISGFQVSLEKEKFIQILAKVGCAMTGQTDQVVPADKKLYALRDVTGTVECIPLIAASILSKKLAEGTQALVLDVKVGSGAFMKTKSQAKALAKTLTLVGKKMGLPCRAILSNMNQPLGHAVGNALEVRESIEVLKNQKNGDFTSADLKELTIHLCAHMLELSGTVRNIAAGRKLAQTRLADGSAWNVFQELVTSQGGNVKILHKHEDIPLAPQKAIWRAKKRGFIGKMNTENLGRLLVELGGGRKKTTDVIHPGVGFLFHKKLGSKVQTGDPLVTVFAPEQMDLTPLESQFHQSVEISGARLPVPTLILDCI